MQRVVGFVHGIGEFKRESPWSSRFGFKFVFCRDIGLEKSGMGHGNIPEQEGFEHKYSSAYN